jgi:hypothetical protein
MAVHGQNRQLSDMAARFSYLRLGVVTSVNPVFALVTVGEVQLRASYLRGIPPGIGDTVSVLRQDATWHILGTTSASGQVLTQNASFEDVDDSGIPSLWFFYNVTNSSRWESVPSEFAVDGERALNQVPAVPTATSFAYSSPVAVETGQTVELGVYAGGDYPGSGTTPTSDARLYALWFATASALYPTTSSADSLIQTVNNIQDADFGMVSLSGTVTVPAATSFVRIGLRGTVEANMGLWWDYATIRVRES